MYKSKLFILLVVVVFWSFIADGIISINPATFEEEIVLIPAEKERSTGRSVDVKVRKHFDLPVDPLMQERIGGIGNKLALGTDRNDFVYRFTVLNHEKDDCYNAFAVPGGYIYIFDDLVEKLDTDDNIAGVLAHEMGHVEARHAVKRMQGSIGATILMLLGSQMKSEPGSFASANRAIGHLMAAYSRHDEREADELSIKYMKLAGFDPNGAVNAIEVLKVLRKEAPRMRVSDYKTHPYLSERSAYLKNFVRGYTDFNSYINIVPER